MNIRHFKIMNLVVLSFYILHLHNLLISQFLQFLFNRIDLALHHCRALSGVLRVLCQIFKFNKNVSHFQRIVIVQLP